MGSLLAMLASAAPTLAVCSSPDTGRWVNLDPNDDPAQIEIAFAECGDTVQTETRVVARVFTQGGRYQRRPVTASYRASNGYQWVFAKVPTGGYVDHMWMRRVRHDNQELLFVYIRHQSLDRKPSAESRHYYRRQ